MQIKNNKRTQQIQRNGDDILKKDNCNIGIDRCRFILTEGIEIDSKKEVKKKIDVIYNGKNAKQVISEVIKYTDTTLAVAPKEQQEAFIIEFNGHKAKNGRMKKSI